MDAGRVIIADILRSRGNKGEVLAKSQTDVPGRLENLKEAQARLTDGTDLPVQLETSWQHKGDWIFKFSGVDSIGDADRFAGAELWIPREDRGSLPAGEYFHDDLIGSLVSDSLTGEVIGPVTDCHHFGASPLLEVDYQNRQVLIPLVDSICRVVDVENRRILVDLPEGLLDLQ